MSTLIYGDPSVLPGTGHSHHSKGHFSRWPLSHSVLTGTVTDTLPNKSSSLFDSPSSKGLTTMTPSLQESKPVGIESKPPLVAFRGPLELASACPLPLVLSILRHPRCSLNHDQHFPLVIKLGPHCPTTVPRHVGHSFLPADVPPLIY